MEKKIFLEKGIVRDVGDDFIRLEVQKKSALDCAKCGACGLKDTSLKILELKGRYSYKPGDEVMIEIQPSSVLLATILVFVIPLVMFVGGCILGSFFPVWFEDLTLSRTESGIIVGLALIFLSFFAAFLIEKKISKENKPRIVE